MTDTPWGPIGYPVYKRTYARRLGETGQTEEFTDTIDRVIRACNEQLGCGFTPDEQAEFRNLQLALKCSVAGRFLWQLGTETVDQLGLLSLQNCASTVVDNPITPFTWAFDCLMLGSGVGFNIQKEFVYEMSPLQPRPVAIARTKTNDADFIVPDSREGWIELLRRVLTSVFYTGEDFTYSTVCIRPKGELIKRFGGQASGPEPLVQGISRILTVLNKRVGKKARPIDCLDVMNIIGKIVVAGNVRRSAQIALGDCDDFQYLAAKDWGSGTIPQWRESSNNSVVCNDIGILPEKFWEGYQGNGEPYGLINLRLSRECGRIGETQYPDPTVMGYNPCVSGDTEVLTSNGYERIDRLVGKPTKVWNGFEWSDTEPRITGYDQPMLKVSLSDGREMRCTYTHKWVTSDNERLEAQDLKVGQKLLKHDFPVVFEEGPSDVEGCYAQGFYSADGGHSNIYLFSTKQMCKNLLEMSCKFTGPYRTRNSEVYRWQGTLESGRFLPKAYVPTPDDSCIRDALAWFSGLCDGDGHLTEDGNLQITSVDRDFLSKVQDLLTLLGQNSKVTMNREAGKRVMPGGEYHCQATYRLMLSAKSVESLHNMGLMCQRLDTGSVKPNRDASRFTTVVGIEESGVESVVYCFTEDKRNLGCFNGIVTGQCAEQSLGDKETCCLAEVFLPKIEDQDTFKKVLSYLYRVCKHSLSLGCHHVDTEEIVHNNMRMGIGLTGTAQSSSQQLSWRDSGYTYLRQLDNEYSDSKGFPRSVKLTTCKPSGTLSLLPGVTPGVHPGFSEYHIRRVRTTAGSPLEGAARAGGYPIEYAKRIDGSEDHSTLVIEFPCSFPSGTLMANDCSAVDQLEVVKDMQTQWSDNAVSCTVYYKKEELPSIQEWLSKNYNENVKSCSFLLHSGHGFLQAPLEEITKEEYEARVSAVRPITSMTGLVDDDELGEACESGACPIK